MTKSEQVRGLQCLDGKQETADVLACVCIDAVEKDTAFHCEVPIMVDMTLPNIFWNDYPLSPVLALRAGTSEARAQG